MKEQDLPWLLRCQWKLKLISLFFFHVITETEIWQRRKGSLYEFLKYSSYPFHAEKLLVRVLHTFPNPIQLPRLEVHTLRALLWPLPSLTPSSVFQPKPLLGLCEEARNDSPLPTPFTVNTPNNQSSNWTLISSVKNVFLKSPQPDMFTPSKSPWHFSALLGFWDTPPGMRMLPMPLLYQVQAHWETGLHFILLLHLIFFPVRICWENEKRGKAKPCR